MLADIPVAASLLILLLVGMAVLSPAGRTPKHSSVEQPVEEDGEFNSQILQDST